MKEMWNLWSQSTENLKGKHCLFHALYVLALSISGLIATIISIFFIKSRHPHEIIYAYKMI